MEHSILSKIGNTPIVEIKSLNSNPNVKIFAKLEYFNPAGSSKDRAAFYMIDKGEKEGILNKDKIVLEATSGNTGIGLSFICGVKGYKLLLIMSEAVSIERQQILKAMGADILFSDGNLGTDGAIEKAYEIFRENPDKYFLTDQYNNPANWLAHYETTAPEIIKQTDGKITHFVAAIGTSGTLMGVSKGLKKFNPNIKIVCAEPYLGHKIQGLKNMQEAYVPSIFDPSCIDEKIKIEDEAAFETTRQLSKKEGLFLGMSSGAAVYVALQKAKTMKSGTIVVLCPDGGERYLSTPLFESKSKLSVNFFNSLSKKKEEFSEHGKITLYASALNLNSKISLDELRKFIFIDSFLSYLKVKKCDFEFVLSLSDFDDKIIDAFAKSNQSFEDFTIEKINNFLNDLKFLSIDTENFKKARTSKYFDEMINIADKLVEKSFAYEKLRSLYFDTSKIKDYGVLSSISPESLDSDIKKEMIFEAYQKQNPKDFSLLKKSSILDIKSGLFIKSKWGNVKPSIHLQSYALCQKLLSADVDFYINSENLIFPHNENEISISSALKKKIFAKFFLHTARVEIQKEEELDFDSLKKQYPCDVIRFWFLSHHHQKTLKCANKSIEAAKNSLAKINFCIQRLKQLEATSKLYDETTDEKQIVYDIRQSFEEKIKDNFNVALFLNNLLEFVKKINFFIQNGKISKEGAKKILMLLSQINLSLKSFSFDEDLNKDVLKLMQERTEARLKKDFKKADEIRDKLLDMGVDIFDSKI